MHFPVAFVPGCLEASSAEQVDDVPLGETWRAMEALVTEGLVRNIGVSNSEIADLEEVAASARIPIACNQIETHPYYQRNGEA